MNYVPKSSVYCKVMYLWRTIFAMPDMLTVSQAAEEAGRTPSSIRRSIRSGFLKAEKVGSIWIIHRKDFAEYLQNPPKPGPRSD